MARKYKPEPGVIHIDVRPMIYAFKEMAARAVDTIAALGGLLGWPEPPQRRRRKLGAGNGAPAVWQSDLCAAWLHDDCGARGLCTCRCHA